jgi:hypothetical protein
MFIELPIVFEMGMNNSLWEISPLNNGIIFWNNKNSTMTCKEVPVTKSWPPSIRQKECIKCVCCDMYRNIYYYIMMTITLYECDLCDLVQDFYSLSKLLGGGGLTPPSPPPLVSTTVSERIYKHCILPF